MRIQDIMNKNVKVCHADTNLATAAAMMWEGDCGVLPVVDKNNKVTGMLTDRDICIAVATRGKLASEIKAKDVIKGEVFSCLPDENVDAALDLMRQRKVRRLPIVNKDNVLQGIVSMNDIVLRATEDKAKGINYEQIVRTYQDICQHPVEAEAGIATPAYAEMAAK